MATKLILPPPGQDQIQAPVPQPEQKADQKPPSRAEEVFGNRPLVGIVVGFLRERNLLTLNKGLVATLRERTGMVMVQECSLFPFSGRVRDQRAEQVLRGQEITKRVPAKKATETLRIFPSQNGENSASEELLQEQGVVDPLSVEDLYDYAVQSYQLIENDLDKIRTEAYDNSLENLHASWNQVKQNPLFQKNVARQFDKKNLDRSELLQIGLLFHDLRAMLNNRWIKEGPRGDWIAHLSGILHAFHVRYALAERFALVFELRREPQEMAGRFKALQQNQREGAANTQTTLERFRDVARTSNGSYAHEHFMKLEAVAIDGEKARFTNLKNLADALRDGLEWSRQGELRLAEFTTTRDLLVHIYDSEELLQSIETVAMCDVNFSDPEVIRILSLLKGLKILQIRARSAEYALREWPQELAAFPHLQVLLLEGHAFTKIPDIATKIPNLLVFGLLNNRERIEELPEDFTRHYLSGWASLAFEPLRELAPLVNCFFGLMARAHEREVDRNAFFSAVYNYHTACLPYEQFKRIPFHLWFREHFSIPYIPTMALGLYEAALFGLIGVTTDFLTRCIDGDLNTRGCINMISMLLFGILSLPITLALVLLDIPIFIANVIINRVIEPFVSWIRERCCGCDPMVEL